MYRNKNATQEVAKKIYQKYEKTIQKQQKASKHMSCHFENYIYFCMFLQTFVVLFFVFPMHFLVLDLFADFLIGFFRLFIDSIASHCFALCRVALAMHNMHVQPQTNRVRHPPNNAPNWPEDLGDRKGPQNDVS